MMRSALLLALLPGLAWSLDVSADRLGGRVQYGPGDSVHVTPGNVPGGVVVEPRERMFSLDAIVNGNDDETDLGQRYEDLRTAEETYDYRYEAVRTWDEAAGSWYNDVTVYDRAGDRVDHFVANDERKEGIDNIPSVSPGDPYGFKGPIRSGAYNIVSRNSPRYGHNQPSLTNTGAPGQVAGWTTRESIMIHGNGESWGCIMVGRTELDEIRSRMREGEIQVWDQRDPRDTRMTYGVYDDVLDLTAYDVNQDRIVDGVDIDDDGLLDSLSRPEVQARLGGRDLGAIAPPSRPGDIVTFGSSPYRMEDDGSFTRVGSAAPLTSPMPTPRPDHIGRTGTTTLTSGSAYAPLTSPVPTPRPERPTGDNGTTTTSSGGFLGDLAQGVSDVVDSVVGGIGDALSSIGDALGGLFS